MRRRMQPRGCRPARLQRVGGQEETLNTKPKGEGGGGGGGGYKLVWWASELPKVLDMLQLPEGYQVGLGFRAFRV